MRVRIRIIRWGAGKLNRWRAGIVAASLATAVGCTASTQPEEPPRAERSVAAPSTPSGSSEDFCNITRLEGLDLFGDGSEITAFTATEVTESGRCSRKIKNSYVVGIDVDADGSADATSETLRWCVFCRPVGVSDFDADGDNELVVLQQGGSVSSYGIYSVEPDGVTAMTVAAPGHPAAGHRPGRPLIFWVGGDEGFSGAATCRSYPHAPILILTWSDHLVEGPGSETTQVHST